MGFEKPFENLKGLRVFCCGSNVSSVTKRSTLEEFHGLSPALVVLLFLTIK